MWADAGLLWVKAGLDVAGEHPDQQACYYADGITLGSFEFGKLEVEVLVGENVKATEEGVGSGFLRFVMEEDPEKYEAAGISLPGTSTAHNSVSIKKNN